MQTKIPCVIMRGGTSRGPFFKLSDLPADVPTRDAVLLAVMGSPHEIQVDGIGGSHSVTSKVAMISKSKRPDADVDYLFAQVQIHESFVDTKPNCGNMLVAVGPFAIEAGLVPATRRRDAGAHLQRQHPVARRGDRADAGRPGRSMKATPRSTACRARRRRSGSISRSAIGVGHREGAAHRQAARRDRRRRGELRGHRDAAWS